ncbi:WhiB family transcriptional regulator [Streptomyces sp. sk226]|uniref:WhiB family transcriptional regulator n=1 Tax=Streptomyces sp. sk226 TaxID=2034268 RepID=UPI000BF0D1AE|nr:WhiB family transcriptional regulator [Streptomyces sp. sk226]
MPETAEQLLALLETPHWITPGSTTRKAETRTARRTEGQPAVNLTVLDHVTAGRQVLAEADRRAAKGTTYAMRQAEALRQAQAVKTRALMGEAGDVRRLPCPACATYGLLLVKGRAVCANRHCAVKKVRRTWAVVDLMMAQPATPKPVVRSATRPSDDWDLTAIVKFLSYTGRPMSASSVHRLVRTYKLPSWPSRRSVSAKARSYSLSDVLTAHAVTAQERNPSDCAVAAKPACTGLAEAFFYSDARDGYGAHLHAEDAKALCNGCPFKDPCLSAALGDADELQHGVRGGLTAKERRQMKTANKIPTTTLRTGKQPTCRRGHLRTAENTDARRRCLTCSREQYAEQKRAEQQAPTP